MKDDKSLINLLLEIHFNSIKKIKSIFESKWRTFFILIKIAQAQFLN